MSLDTDISQDKKKTGIIYANLYVTIKRSRH